MHADWFDSPSLLREVLECLNMKDAISTLESTVITIGVMLLKEVAADDNEALNDDLENPLHSTRNSLDGKDGSPEFAFSWSAFCTKLNDMKLR